MDRDRILLGSVDDAVGRNPWPGLPQTLQELNALLVFYALLGPRPEIAFGNIAYNPTFQGAIMGPNGAPSSQNSPLIPLVSSGLIGVYQRLGSLHDSVESRATQGHAHAREFLNLTGRAQLDCLQHLFGPGLRQQETSDEQFAKLLKIVYARAPEPFRRAADLANDYAEHTGKSLSRTSFEKVLEKPEHSEHFGDVGTSIMQMATALKHFAHARNMGVSVETKLFGFAGSLIAQERAVRTENADLARLGERIQAAKSEILRCIRVPADTLTDPSIWDRFRPGSTEFEAFLIAKRELRACLDIDLFSAADEIDGLRDTGKDAAKRFNLALENLVERKALSNLDHLSFTSIPIISLSAAEYAANLIGLPPFAATVVGIAMDQAHRRVFGSPLVSRALVRLFGSRDHKLSKKVDPDNFESIAFPSIVLPA